MPLINFFVEDTKYNLKQKVKIRQWIRNTVEAEGRKLGELNYIFCSDDYLLKINQEYLKHNTYTDIITFDNSDEKHIIIGDIFISIDRVLENAAKYNVRPEDEVHRVLIHGALHLSGYKDKTRSDKALMTDKENQYLLLRAF